MMPESNSVSTGVCWGMLPRLRSPERGSPSAVQSIRLVSTAGRNMDSRFRGNDDWRVPGYDDRVAPKVPSDLPGERHYAHHLLFLREIGGIDQDGVARL